MLVIVATPLITSEDSDALKGNNNLELNSNSAIVYVDSNSSDHSYTFTVSFKDSFYSESDIVWRLNNIGDGTDLVSFDDTDAVYTYDGESATVYGKNVGSIEIEAYVESNENYYASAVIVVFNAESTPATTFHYYFKIDREALTDVGVTPTIPTGKTINDFYNGFWVSVSQSEANLASFNALTALNWYLSTNHWEKDIQSSGWINTLLDLGTYSGDGNSWIYWAQYHYDGNGWAFNNTTLSYITSVDSSYIGLIFRESGSPNDKVDFPGLPNGA